MPANDNESIVRRFVEQIMIQGDGEEVQELVAEGFRCWGPGPTRLHGADALKNFCAFMRSGWERGAAKWQLEIRYLVDGPNGAAVVLQSPRVIQTGSELYFLSAQAQAEMESITHIEIPKSMPESILAVFRIENGKVIELWQETNDPFVPS